MGLSFHDESSLEEVVGSLRFASDPPKPNSETGSIGIIDQERREDDFGVERITDIERREDDFGAERITDIGRREGDFGVERVNHIEQLSLYIDQHWNM